MAPGVALVCGLAGHAEGLGDLHPGPPVRNRLVDGRELEPIGEPPERHHRRQRFGRVIREGEFGQ